MTTNNKLIARTATVSIGLTILAAVVPVAMAHTGDYCGKHLSRDFIGMGKSSASADGLFHVWLNDGERLYVQLDVDESLDGNFLYGHAFCEGRQYGYVENYGPPGVLVIEAAGGDGHYGFGTFYRGNYQILYTILPAASEPSLPTYEPDVLTTIY